jgi:hypothetical protein
VRALSKADAPDASPASYRWTVFEDLVPESQQQQQQQPATQPKPKPKKKQQSDQPPTLVG